MADASVSAIVETINPTTDETVLIEYATNFVETYTTVGTCDATGEKSFRFPSAVDKKGVPFRAWKWRITFARGSTVTNTPQLVKITLVWRPKVETLYGIGATIVWSGLATFVILKIVDAAFGLRVGEEEEVEGLDINLHGEVVP